MMAVKSPWEGAGGIMMDLPNVFAMLTSIAGFLWIFLRMDSWLLLTTLTITLISSLILNKIPKSYDKYWASMSPNWNKFAKLNNEMKSPLSKQDILIYNSVDLFKSYYGKTNRDRIGELSRVNSKTLGFFSLANVINLLRDGLIMYWLLTSLISGRIDIGDFYVYFTAIFAFIEFNRQSMWVYSDIRRNYTMFKPFFKIIEVYRDDKEEIYPDKLEITFDDVSFKYPKSKDYVLKNISFTIKNGESIALVGENGAGKSTLALILAGFYKPTQGRILINGKDLEDSKIDYKKLVSAVFQDSSLLPFSFKENVLLSSEDRDINHIYSLTHLNEIIEKYDKKDRQSLLRILDSDGVDLSGGQKQRLFLARAIAKDRSKILILDEPTAQLDALNERELYMLYDDLIENKSSIFISHRLASTKFCDRIIYLRDGQILDQGSHDELIRTSPDYRDLYELQAKNYKEVL